MTQFGVGPSFLAQCPPTPPVPAGYVGWNETHDGAVPAAAVTRAVQLANDMTKPLGYTENVGDLLLRVEPHTWTERNGQRLTGCFHGITVYKPAPIMPPTSKASGAADVAALLLTTASMFALAKS